MPDIQALANKRSRAILKVTQHPGFCPIDKAFKSPIEGDFTLIRNAYFVESPATPLSFQIRTEFQTGLSPNWVNVPNGTIYLYSQDKPEVGVHEGAVIIIGVLLAGKYLADGTHKIATMTQIVSYLRKLAANNAVIDQKELQRDPVAYAARVKVMRESQNALLKAQSEGHTLYTALPAVRPNPEPDDKYIQEDDDWKKGNKPHSSTSPSSIPLPSVTETAATMPGIDPDFARVDPSQENFTQFGYKPGPVPSNVANMDNYSDPDGSRTHTAHTIPSAPNELQLDAAKGMPDANPASVPPPLSPMKKRS